MAAAVTLHMPSAPGATVQAAEPTTSPRRSSTVLVSQLQSLQRYRLSADSIPVFSSIFAQDTIASVRVQLVPGALGQTILPRSAVPAHTPSVNRSTKHPALKRPESVRSRREPRHFQRSTPHIVSFSATSGNFRPQTQWLCGQDDQRMGSLWNHDVSERDSPSALPLSRITS